MNVRFNYLYRDGANYKQYGHTVFSNNSGLTSEEIENTIKACLIEANWFYADKWHLKDLQLYKWDEEIDHNWHEYENVELTGEEATGGDISDFVALIWSE